MSGAPNKVPKWREEFPIETEADEYVSRRDFVRFLALVSAGLALGNGAVLVKSLTSHDGKPLPIADIGAADELERGAWRVFQYPDAKTDSILVRRTNGDLIAFQQKCPHLACPVSYHPGDGEKEECLLCHCHNGRFDIETGKGSMGPPRELRPLRQVALRIENGRILAVGLNDIEVKG